MNQKVVPGLGPQTGANLINVRPLAHLPSCSKLTRRSSSAPLDHAKRRLSRPVHVGRRFAGRRLRAGDASCRLLRRGPGGRHPPGRFIPTALGPPLQRKLRQGPSTVRLALTSTSGSFVHADDVTIAAPLSNSREKRPEPATLPTRAPGTRLLPTSEGASGWSTAMWRLGPSSGTS